MAPDQHEPAHTAVPAIEVVIVDPDALNSAARRLDDLPGPHSPAAAPPTAAEVGQRGLAEEIAEFHQRYRAVENALAADTERATSHLDEAAQRYRRSDDESASQLIELIQDALPTAQGPDCHDEQNTDNDRDRDRDHDNDHRDHDHHDDGDHDDGDHDDRDHDDDRDDHDRDDHDRDDHDRDDHDRDDHDHHDDHGDRRTVYET